MKNDGKEVNYVKIKKFKSEREAVIFYFAITLSLVLIIIIVPHVLDRPVKIQKEDVDGDGIDEIIKEYELADGGISRDIIDDDGTIYVIILDSQGNVLYKTKTTPEGDVYMWDDEGQQWILTKESEKNQKIRVNRP
jgi:hypothetical protein